MQRPANIHLVHFLHKRTQRHSRWLSDAFDSTSDEASGSDHIFSELPDQRRAGNVALAERNKYADCVPTGAQRHGLPALFNLDQRGRGHIQSNGGVKFPLSVTRPDIHRAVACQGHHDNFHESGASRVHFDQK